MTVNFFIALVGELLTILFVAVLNRRPSGETGRVTATLIWAVIYAAAAAISIRLLRASRKQWRWRFIAIGIALAPVAYVAALIITGGYIRNLIYPLLLIFLSGSVPAFVREFYPRAPSLSVYPAAVAWILVLGFSVIPTAVRKLEQRTHRIRITVVKLTPGNGLGGPTIASAPGVSLPDYERAKLNSLGLVGRAYVGRVQETGPKDTPVSHMIIILTHPVEGNVELAEPKDEVIFLQEKDSWKRIPENALLSSRKLGLYSSQWGCTEVDLRDWGFEALCWDDD